MRGDGSIYERKGRTVRYWIKYWHRGKVYREVGGKTEEEARRKLRKRVKEIHAERFVGPDAERVTVKELIKSYLEHLKLKGAKSMTYTRAHGQAVLDALGDERSVDLSAEMIEGYMQKRLECGSRRYQGQKVKPATVNREMEILRAALRLAWKRGRLLRVPYIPRLAEGNARQGFLEPADFDRIEAELPDYLKDLAWFAYITGWRKSEVAKLHWQQVEPGEPPLIRLPTSKNGKPRSLPCIDDLATILERREEARKVKRPNGTTFLAEYIFHRDGEPVGDFWHAWRTACTKAKVPTAWFHDFRRSAIRNMLKAGAREREAMEITGHKTRAIFDRYHIVTEEDKARVLASTMQRLKERKTGTVLLLRKKKEKGS